MFRRLYLKLIKFRNKKTNKTPYWQCCTRINRFRTFILDDIFNVFKNKKHTQLSIFRAHETFLE